MKRSVLLLAVILLTFSVSVGVAADYIDHKVPATIAYPSDNFSNQHAIPEYVWSPSQNAGFNELDEYMGDTLSVGNTYYNAQHNCTMGRMVAFTPDGVSVNGSTETNVAFFSWMDKPGPNSDVHIAFNRGYVDGSGAMQYEIQNGYTVDAGTVAAYVTLGFDATNHLGFPVYHGGNDGDNMGTILAHEWDVFPGTFIEQTIPAQGDEPQYWPRSAYDSQNGVMHVVTTVNPDDPNEELVLPQPIYYSRHVHNDDGTFTINDQVLLCEYQRNISADIAVSEDGQRVAVVATISRDYLEHPDDVDEWSQYNQDIWLYLSEDGGENWNDYVNLTNFIPPDEDLLPDTTAANRDTLRAYCDCNAYFDMNDKLHVAFTTCGYFQLQGSLYTRYSWIYHWDEASDFFTLVVDGRQYCYDPGGWHRAADRPNMYQDPKDGTLYMVYQQMGLDVIYPDSMNPDLEVNELDYSQSGFANGEVYIAASPYIDDYYGLLWAKGVNVTNTRYSTDANGAATGDARSECSPTIALNNDGEYLNLFYILDYEGGNARQDEGAYTQNNAVWQRVPKADLLASYSEWVPNMPLHVDSTQYWTDDQGYNWEDTEGFWRGGVDDEEPLMPNEFNLQQNYPNPFNPTTSIAFSLERTGKVHLAVYDVLGRQVAVLANRTMTNGQHTISFDGSDLASGVYFVKMTSGSHSMVRKMTLMK